MLTLVLTLTPEEGPSPVVKIYELRMSQLGVRLKLGISFTDGNNEVAVLGMVTHLFSISHS